MTRLEATIRLRQGSFALDVAIAVAPGETLALLGPNGAGKSTVVSVLAGASPIDDGRIVLGDRVLDDPAAGVFVAPEHRRIGVVFQDRVLFPHMTVAHNVGFAPRRGKRSREASAVTSAWLARLDLGTLADRRPAELSGGEAQRVALARALASDPELLLLDEPFSALDVATHASLRRDLAKHLDEFPGPRILITHDPTDAFLLADRIVIIEKGTAVQTGSPDEIRRHPRSAYAADLAGVNLMEGFASGGQVQLDAAPDLHIADSAIEGLVLLALHPRAISVHIERPEGSPRNTWRTSIEQIERLGDRVRLQLAGPHRLTVEITESSAARLALEPGSPIWVAVKATEISVQPA